MPSRWSSRNWRSMQFAKSLRPSAIENDRSRGDACQWMFSGYVARRLFAPQRAVSRYTVVVRLRLMAAIDLAPPRAAFASRFLWQVGCHGCTEQLLRSFAAE